MALWSGYPAEGIVRLVIAPASRQPGCRERSRQPGCLAFGVSPEAENGKEVRRHSKSRAGGSTSRHRTGDGDEHNGESSSQKC